ncbi:MAG: MBL fold metallo-hydrolase [Ketobacter sp.]|nr:MBL fold metallo-hydrolase [Ketobacter sp.]
MSLRFPFQHAPGKAEAFDITPDIKWLRTPLPLSLDHINCYLLRDTVNDSGQGWCVLDTGMNGQAAMQQWLDVIEAQLQGDHISRVIVTHHHPDHVGLAGWLCDTHKVPLYMTEAEYFYSRAFNSEARQEPYWEVKQYFDQTGISEADRNALLGNKHYKHLVSPVPAAFHRIQDGDILTIGVHQWEAITTRGHAPEHLCLYCKQQDILISGDQVLPQITSNVSVTPTQPKDNPLRHWMNAHTKMARRVPDSVLILPAHQLPFYGLHERLQAVVDHHYERMQAIIALLEKPKTAQQLTAELFDKELEPFQNFLAVGEVVAHLHYLLEEGRVMRELSGHMYYYEANNTNAEGTS